MQKKYSKSFATRVVALEKRIRRDGYQNGPARNLLGHYGFLSVEMISAYDSDTDMDVSDQVSDNVRQNANKDPIGFTDAEVVNDPKPEDKSDASGNGQAQMSGPGF